jgi:PIN domain
VRTFIYDSGALIAIDRRDSAQFERHLQRLVRRNQIIVPAPVAAQVVRNPQRQARLMLALRGCDVLPFEEDHVGPVGGLLARSGTSDVLDAFLVLKAVEAAAAIVTSDPADISLLLDALGVRLPVLKP